MARNRLKTKRFVEHERSVRDEVCGWNGWREFGVDEDSISLQRKTI